MAAFRVGLKNFCLESKNVGIKNYTSLSNRENRLSPDTSYTNINTDKDNYNNNKDDADNSISTLCTSIATEKNELPCESKVTLLKDKKTAIIITYYKQITDEINKFNFEMILKSKAMGKSDILCSLKHAVKRLKFLGQPFLEDRGLHSQHLIKEMIDSENSIQNRLKMLNTFSKDLLETSSGIDKSRYLKNKNFSVIQALMEMKDYIKKQTTHGRISKKKHMPSTNYTIHTLNFMKQINELLKTETVSAVEKNSLGFRVIDFCNPNSLDDQYHSSCNQIKTIDNNNNKYCLQYQNSNSNAIDKTFNNKIDLFRLNSSKLTISIERPLHFSSTNQALTFDKNPQLQISGSFHLINDYKSHCTGSVILRKTKSDLKRTRIYSESPTYILMKKNSLPFLNETNSKNCSLFNCNLKNEKIENSIPELVLQDFIKNCLNRSNGSRNKFEGSVCLFKSISETIVRLNNNIRDKIKTKLNANSSLINFSNMRMMSTLTNDISYNSDSDTNKNNTKLDRKTPTTLESMQNGQHNNDVDIMVTDEEKSRMSVKDLISQQSKQSFYPKVQGANTSIDNSTNFQKVATNELQLESIETKIRPEVLPKQTQPANVMREKFEEMENSIQNTESESLNDTNFFNYTPRNLKNFRWTNHNLGFGPLNSTSKSCGDFNYKTINNSNSLNINKEDNFQFKSNIHTSIISKENKPTNEYLNYIKFGNNENDSKSEKDVKDPLKVKLTNNFRNENFTNRIQTSNEVKKSLNNDMLVKNLPQNIYNDSPDNVNDSTLNIRLDNNKTDSTKQSAQDKDGYYSAPKQQVHKLLPRISSQTSSLRYNRKKNPTDDLLISLKRPISTAEDYITVISDKSTLSNQYSSDYELGFKPKKDNFNAENNKFYEALRNKKVKPCNSTTNKKISTGTQDKQNNFNENKYKDNGFYEKSDKERLETPSLHLDEKYDPAERSDGLKLWSVNVNDRLKKKIQNNNEGLLPKHSNSCYTSKDLEHKVPNTGFISNRTSIRFNDTNLEDHYERDNLVTANKTDTDTMDNNNSNFPIETKNDCLEIFDIFHDNLKQSHRNLHSTNKKIQKNYNGNFGSFESRKMKNMWSTEHTNNFGSKSKTKFSDPIFIKKSLSHNDIGDKIKKIKMKSIVKMSDLEDNEMPNRNIVKSMDIKSSKSSNFDKIKQKRNAMKICNPTPTNQLTYKSIANNLSAVTNNANHMFEQHTNEFKEINQDKLLKSATNDHSKQLKRVAETKEINSCNNCGIHGVKKNNQLKTEFKSKKNTIEKGFKNKGKIKSGQVDFYLISEIMKNKDNIFNKFHEKKYKNIKSITEPKINKEQIEIKADVQAKTDSKNYPQRSVKTSWGSNENNSYNTINKNTILNKPVTNQPLIRHFNATKINNNFDSNHFRKSSDVQNFSSKGPSKSYYLMTDTNRWTTQKINRRKHKRSQTISTRSDYKLFNIINRQLKHKNKTFSFKKNPMYWTSKENNRVIELYEKDEATLVNVIKNKLGLNTNNITEFLQGNKEKFVSNMSTKRPETMQDEKTGNSNFSNLQFNWKSYLKNIDKRKSNKVVIHPMKHYSNYQNSLKRNQRPITKLQLLCNIQERKKMKKVDHHVDCTIEIDENKRKIIKQLNNKFKLKGNTITQKTLEEYVVENKKKKQMTGSTDNNKVNKNIKRHWKTKKHGLSSLTYGGKITDGISRSKNNQFKRIPSNSRLNGIRYADYNKHRNQSSFSIAKKNSTIKIKDNGMLYYDQLSAADKSQRFTSEFVNDRYNWPKKMIRKPEISLEDKISYSTYKSYSNYRNQNANK